MCLANCVTCSLASHLCYDLEHIWILHKKRFTRLQIKLERFEQIGNDFSIFKRQALNMQFERRARTMTVE